MYRPRCFSLLIKPDINSLKSEISVLTKKSEISASDETFEYEISYDKVLKILKEENASMKQSIDYEIKRKKILTKSLERISKYQKYEEEDIACCNDYINNESFLKTEAVDESTELFFEMEVLHRKICTLLKKFSHLYYSVEESNLDTSERDIYMEKNNQTGYKHKKGLLDILKHLVPELNSENNGGNESAVLYADDTMQDEHIEFLLSANIIERCPDDPNYVKLSD